MRLKKDDCLIYNYNGKLKLNARRLRKEMTKEESRLWYEFLKQLPVVAKRQKIIGNYIVDFYLETEAVKVVIELDGSQHYDGEQELRDKKRDEELSKLGIMILRYSNKEINENFRNVCEDIYKYLNI